VSQISSEAGSIAPFAVVGAGVLMCLTATIAGSMQVFDAYARLASRADQLALLSAQHELMGESGCQEVRPSYEDRLESCESDGSGTSLTLSRVIRVWSQDFKITANGRYLRLG